MPLYLEIRKQGAWGCVGTHRQGEQSGSLSHNGPNGREIYSFECLGERSVVRRSLAGVDAEVGPERVISSLEFEIVDELTDEHPSLEFFLRTDRMREPARFRFRHAT